MYDWPDDRDWDIALSAIKVYPQHLKDVAYIQRIDRDFMLAAMQANGLALEFLPKEFEGDIELEIAAICENGEALGFASTRARSDQDIVCAAARNNPEAVVFAVNGLSSSAFTLHAAGIEQSYEALVKAAERELENGTHSKSDFGLAHTWCLMSGWGSAESRYPGVRINSLFGTGPYSG
jgi:hypothetical protein